MKQQLNIVVPTSWKDLDLYTYLRWQKEAKNYADNEDALLDLMIHYFCHLDYDTIKGMSIESYNNIKSLIAKFEKMDEFPLTRFVKFGDVEYGFEPNLSKMAYGAYVDIAQYEDMTMDKHWPKIMNILYRPVTSKKGELYTIEPYTGKTDWDKWLGVSMDIHFGALFFFIHLHRDLLHSILNFSSKMELPPNIKQTLQKSGEIIQRSMNWQEVIYKRWMM